MLPPLFSLLPFAGFASKVLPFRASLLHAPARNVLRVFFSVQFSRNDLRPTPENDIVRKEEEPSVPFILVPFTRFPWRSTWDCDELLHHILPRKEVIQPHLPIRLPCYDFTPVIGLTLGGCFLIRLALPTLGTPDSHGVTGGVYKTRERIHPDILIRDY